MKIVILDAKTLGDDINLECFSEYGQVKIYDYTYDVQILERCIKADIIITNKVKLNANILKECKNLKLISVTATGLNNIDCEYAKNQNIDVKNVINYSVNTVSQHTFALVLNLMLDMRTLDNYVTSKQYMKSNSFTYWNKSIFELNGKKWGIIGLGAIGQKVANIATSFGCEVITFSPSANTYGTTYKQIKSLDEFLKQCNIISIHTPLNKHTNNLITKQELMSMKDGAIIVNVARGGIINENDLCETIDNKELYIGLDVLCSEPMDSNSKFLDIKHKNRLLITPHSAWSAYEARVEIIRQTKEYVEKFVREYKI